MKRRTMTRWKIDSGARIGGVAVLDDRIVDTARCFWWLHHQRFSEIRARWEPRGWTFTEMEDSWVLERNC